MTLGAAALGIAATGLFGYAAALTYTGTTSTVNAADQQVTGFSGGGAIGDAGSRSSSRSGSSSQTQTQAQGGIVNPFNGVLPPQSGTGRHHAATGGS
jgi:hypothetical protein